MPDEEKREDNLHQLDEEPATGNLNDTPNDNDDTEQRASSVWSGSNYIEPKKDAEADLPDTDEKSSMSHEDKPPINPLHSDIPPATIPMSTRRKGEAQQAGSESNDELPKPGPGLMVLQWLTYAFWGWTVFSLSGLIITVVGNLINHTSDTSWLGGIAYLLAAVIVLFIIAFVTDIFYAKGERKHSRSTGTNVIMIIHAVLFALFAIGSLIVAVFGLVSLLINDTSESTGPLTSIISGAVIAVLYGLTLLRTLRPRWIKAVAPMYWVIMTLTIVVTVALGIIGPAAQVRLQNEDKVVEQGTPDVARSINSYTNAQNKLPRSLSDLTSVSTDGKKLIDEHKVTYQPGEQISPTVKKLNLDNSSSYSSNQSPIYHYTLCVDYKAKDDSSYTSYYDSPSNGQRYQTSVSTYGHKAGHVCYDLQTDYIYNY